MLDNIKTLTLIKELPVIKQVNTLDLTTYYFDTKINPQVLDLKLEGFLFRLSQIIKN